jgi:hypothetical protein
MGYRSKNCALKPHCQQQKFQPKARDVLVSWARKRECWDRANDYLRLARSTPAADVRDRFVAIAQHYRALAIAEQRIGGPTGATRHR